MTALVLALALASTQEALAPAPAPASDTDARLLVGVLDYVAADYGGAVRAGKVVKESEYQEQLSFVEEAVGMAARLPGLPAATAPRLHELDQAVRRRAPPAEVASRCRAIRDEIVGKLRLVVAPALPPAPGRGAALFAKNCAVCHGEDGRARTERAKALTPPPRDFQDREVMRGLSPYRAFGALTFGVNGTAMAAFPTLSDEDRWSLAFHVFSFFHGARADEGRRAIQRTHTPVPPLGELTLRSDGELEAALRVTGLDANAVAAAVSYLRVDGYRASADPLDKARRRVAEAGRWHAAGQGDRARALVLDAYLSFEAVESRLRTREASLVADAEGAFMDLRRALRGEAPATEVRARVGAVDRLLGQAQAVLTRAAPRGRLAFGASLVIFLREAVEAALLVGLLLGLLARSGRGELRRFVHAGWSVALIAGIATFWVVSRLLRAQSLNQELLEGVVSLLAAAVLFYVSYWTLSQAQSQRWLKYLRDQVEGGGRAMVLFGLAFLAVFREAFETVLFYQALLLERDADRVAIVAGAGAGAVLALVAVWILRRVGARLPMAPFFNVSGALLCLLAVVFAGAGLNSLRKSGWMDSRPIGLPSIELLGLYPDAVGLAVQVAMVVVIASGLAAIARRRGES